MTTPGYRWACTLIAALVCVTFSQAPAQGGHASGSNSGNPNDRYHYIDRNTVTTAVSNAVVHGISQLNRSEMSATLSGSGDVEVYDAYYGTGGDWNNRYGVTWCSQWGPYYNWCDIHVVQYNLTYFAGYSSSRQNSGGCHELGHTAGLGHRTATTDTDDNSCMRETASSTWPSYDQHDLDAINAVI